MMPRFLTNTQTFILSTCLIFAFCHGSGAQVPSSDTAALWVSPTPLPQGTQLIQHFIQDMRAGEIGYARYGFPFWLDSRWIKDKNTLNALFAEGAKQRPFPVITDLHVEIHPLSTLQVKSAKAWERLSQKAEASFLKNTRLAVVFFEIKKEGQSHREESWLLVQPVETALTEDEVPTWQLVGLLER